MGLIKTGMSIQCRTEEEIAVFKEVATAEGHKFRGGNDLFSIHNDGRKKSFQIGFDDAQFPCDVTVGLIDKDYSKWGIDIVVVEASDLFRNYIIARRVKNGTNTTTNGS